MVRKLSIKKLHEVATKGSKFILTPMAGTIAPFEVTVSEHKSYGLIWKNEIGGIGELRNMAGKEFWQVEDVIEVRLIVDGMVRNTATLQPVYEELPETLVIEKESGIFQGTWKAVGRGNYPYDCITKDTHPNAMVYHRKNGDWATENGAWATEHDVEIRNAIDKAKVTA